MSDDFEEKNEAPTDRRRTEARRQGNVARSADLTAAGLMLGAACVLAVFGLSLVQGMAELLHDSLRNPAGLDIDTDWTARRMLEVANWLGWHVLPPLLVLMGCALVANLLQVGFLYSPEVLAPKLSRIDPLEGAQRIVSTRSLLQVAMNVAKILLAAAIAAWSISALLPEVLALAGGEAASGSSRTAGAVPLISGTIRRTVVRLAFELAGALLVLAVLDYGLQRWMFERGLRMTRQELRDELRHAQGARVTRSATRARQPPLSRQGN